MKNIRNGTVSIEAILAIAAGALVLMGIMQMTSANLLHSVNNTIAKLLNPNSAIDGSNANGDGVLDSPSSNANGTSAGTANQSSNGATTGETRLPNTEPAEPTGGSGETKPVGDGLVKDFILESIKQKAKDLTKIAVKEAERELENYARPRLPMDLDIELDDWELQNAKLNQSLVENIGTLVGAINAVDGLNQADQKVKDLADQGKYREAFGTIFSGSSRFITDAILSSKAVNQALDKLPSAAQVAIQSTIPNAIESVTQDVGESVFDSVGKKINDQLWDWHDRGFVPRPRIPRDYDFGSSDGGVN